MPQIIHLPPVRPQKKKGVDPKMRDRVLEFLDRFPDGLPDDFLDRIANDVMLGRFGYTPTEGKPLAVRTLQALEQEGKVRIRYDEHPKKKFTPAVVEVRRVIDEPAPIAAPPAAPAKAAKPAFNPMRAVHLHASHDHRSARQERRDRRIGDRNEGRFHVAMVRLAGALTTLLPSVFLSADASRSGRHCPSKGKIDLRDHCGDDVALRLTTRIAATGAPRTRRLVYDVKSSRIRAEEANERIRRITGEGLKRAITVNHLRSDREFIEEVLADIDALGLAIDPPVRTSILDHFSD